MIAFCAHESDLELDLEKTSALLCSGVVNYELTARAEAGDFISRRIPSSQNRARSAATFRKMRVGPHARVCVTSNHVTALNWFYLTAEICRVGSHHVIPSLRSGRSFCWLGRGRFGWSPEITVKLLRKAESVKTLAGDI